jgi:hypothetical protein
MAEVVLQEVRFRCEVDQLMMTHRPAICEGAAYSSTESQISVLPDAALRRSNGHAKLSFAKMFRCFGACHSIFCESHKKAQPAE